MKRKIAILGSTGSIGTQALDVVRTHPDRFQVEVLTAQSRAERLIAQAREFSPNVVVIGDPAKYAQVREALDPLFIKVYTGLSSLCDVAAWESVDLVLNAIVGFSGLAPSLSAARAGKTLALANKESLVAGGALLMETLRTHRGRLLPVDSEHSAIFQCLQGEASPVREILLTASGGPFRCTPAEEMALLTPAQALRHPVWDMGAKVTIDSATMMNKVLEVLEAYWLFGLEKDQIRVLVHPQSLVHSMVVFADGCVKAQCSTPDMRLPIAYALSYPQRLPLDIPVPAFGHLGSLVFEEPDELRFPALRLARRVMEKGGNSGCVLNAANEWAVAAFLGGKIAFTDIPRCVEGLLETLPFIARPTYEQLQETHTETLRLAQNLFEKNPA